MLVRIVGNIRPIQTTLEFSLRAVHDDQVRTHLQDLFDVRIDERAHLRQLLRVRREHVVGPDGNDAAAGAHRKQHLGG